MRGQRHVPAAIYTWQRPGTYCTEGWVGSRAGLDRCGKSPPNQDLIPGPSSPQPVATPSTLPGPLQWSNGMYIVTDIRSRFLRTNHGRSKFRILMCVKIKTVPYLCKQWVSTQWTNVHHWTAEVSHTNTFTSANTSTPPNTTRLACMSINVTRAFTWTSHFSTLPLASAVQIGFTNFIFSPSLLNMAWILREGSKWSLAIPSKHFFR